MAGRKYKGEWKPQGTEARGVGSQSGMGVGGGVVVLRTEYTSSVPMLKKMNKRDCFCAIEVEVAQTTWSSGQRQSSHTWQREKNHYPAAQKARPECMESEGIT